MKNQDTTARIDVTASLKRIAWAYGCAKKGSDEEAELEVLLVAKMKRAASETTLVPYCFTSQLYIDPVTLRCAAHQGSLYSCNRTPKVPTP